MNLYAIRYDEGVMIEPSTAADDSADRRLIALIAAGDREAFEQFYREYARRVLAFVRDIVHAPDVAEEVASDAMIAVWRAAGRYAGRARVLTWVLSIAHHKAVDALRRRGGAALPLGAIPISRCDPCPRDAFIEIDNRLRLDLAMRALSSEHRTVLQLMFAFDRSHAEIAEIVGCPVATVKTRVFYAKRRLREELERATAAEELI